MIKKHICKIIYSNKAFMKPIIDCFDDEAYDKFVENAVYITSFLLTNKKIVGKNCVTATKTLNMDV